MYNKHRHQYQEQVKEKKRQRRAQRQRQRRQKQAKLIQQAVAHNDTIDAENAARKAKGLMSLAEETRFREHWLTEHTRALLGQRFSAKQLNGMSDPTYHARYSAAQGEVLQSMRRYSRALELVISASASEGLKLDEPLWFTDGTYSQENSYRRSHGLSSLLAETRSQHVYDHAPLQTKFVFNK